MENTEVECKENPILAIAEIVEEDNYIKKLFEEKYVGKPFVFVIGPPKSGTTWLHQTLFRRFKGLSIHSTKDTEVLQGLVSENTNQLQKSARIFAKKFKQRYSKSVAKGIYFGATGVGNYIGPICDVMNMMEYANLYSFFFTPQMMYKTRKKCSGFTYVDASLCYCTIQQLNKIKHLLSSLGMDEIKILLIYRDPVERFLSHAFHKLKPDEGILNLNDVFKNHYNYLNEVLNGNVDYSVSHRSWLKPENTYSNKILSSRIKNGTIFDECTMASQLTLHQHSFSKVFGDNNVVKAEFKSMFTKNGFCSLIKELGFSIEDLELSKINFDEPVGKGSYQAENIEFYKKALKNYLKGQYHYIDNALARKPSLNSPT